MGFKFAYPKEWGQAVTKPGYETENKHLETGSEYVVSFSQNSSVTAGVKSADWKHRDDMGHGQKGSISGLSYANKDKAYFTDRAAKIVHTDNDSFIVGLTITGAGCDGVGHSLIHSLPSNKTYPSVAFLYYDKIASGLFDDTTCDKENYEKYLLTSHLEELKKVEGTIQSY